MSAPAVWIAMTALGIFTVLGLAASMFVRGQAKAYKLGNTRIEEKIAHENSDVDIRLNEWKSGKSSFILFDDSPEISGGSDSWNTFYLGILIGIGGGAVTCLSPWLGGALFAVGYGMTACSLRGYASFDSRLRGYGVSLRGYGVSNALLFGFKWAAIAGALLFAGVFLFPESTGAFVEGVGRRHAIFLGVATLPWFLAIANYGAYIIRAQMVRETASRSLKKRLMLRKLYQKTK